MKTCRIGAKKAKIVSMNRNAEPAIYFMRHGQSLANARGLVAGQLDSPLTELGRQQAEAAGRVALAEGLKFDAIISSDLKRAAETARIVAGILGFDQNRITYTPLLAERGGGDFEGGPIDNYFAAGETEAVGQHGVESLERLYGRAQRLLESLRRDYPAKAVLLVGHSGIGKMLRLAATGQPKSRLDKRQTLPNALIVPLAANDESNLQ